VDLDPIRGREQAGTRTALLVSDDLLNRGPAGLVIAVPITSTDRGIPANVAVTPPEGGLRRVSLVLCEAIRSVSTDRLRRWLGQVPEATMAQVVDRLRILLAL